MKVSIYMSLALVIFLLISAEKSFACSCVASPEPLKKQIQSAFAGANAVFSGEVVEIKESSADKDGLIVKIKIAQSWKGDSSEVIIINTAKDSAMCGYGFEIGKTYLVYASGLTNNLSVNNCSRTSIFSIKGDAKYLSKLKRKAKAS